MFAIQSFTSVIHAPKDMGKLPTIAVKVGDEAIRPSKTASNIGAYIDLALELKEHVADDMLLSTEVNCKNSEISFGIFCHKTLSCFYNSRLDCLNSLLYKIPKYIC